MTPHENIGGPRAPSATPTNTTLSATAASSGSIAAADYVPVGSYVDFASAGAGAILSLAITFVLLSFGAAVGFSAVSPWTSSASGTALSLGAAFWVLLVNAWAFALGGYISGRMRHRWHDGVASEVAFRDGAHGLVTWGIAIVVGAIIAVSAAGYAGRAAGEAMRSDPYRLSDPTIAILDPLFRPADGAEIRGENRFEESRAEAARLLATSVTKDGITVPDRTYLTRLVSARAGLAQPEADRRVQVAIDASKTAANRARKVAIAVGFLTAASLLIGAAVAWWAASIGGKHRDEGTVWQVFGDMSDAVRRPFS